MADIAPDNIIDLNEYKAANLTNEKMASPLTDYRNQQDLLRKAASLGGLKAVFSKFQKDSRLMGKQNPTFRN